MGWVSLNPCTEALHEFGGRVGRAVKHSHGEWPCGRSFAFWVQRSPSGGLDASRLARILGELSRSAC